MFNFNKNVAPRINGGGGGGLPLEKKVLINIDY